MKPSIEDIFTNYKNKIYGLALGITRNSSDAEDIVQNTFLKIMDNIDSFTQRAKLSTWIYRIAYNEALMLLRKRRRRLPSPLAKGADLTRKEILEDEFRDRLELAIKRMPLKYRMALLLHNVEGFSIKDAAAIMGLKTNSMKTRIYRAYDIVKSQVADYLKDKEGTGIIKEGASCNAMLNFVYEYASGALGNARKESFDRHIGDCLPCRSFLDTYTKAINITKALQCQDLPPEMEARLKTFIFK